MTQSAEIVNATSISGAAAQDATLLMYSCYTWLAYQINQTYYGGAHYVWCTPFFNPKSPFALVNAVPPTSSPFEIYRSLREEVDRRERHSAKIAQNRLGVTRGADINKRNGKINDSQHADIIAIANTAESGDFRPLIYIIPERLVAGKIKHVPIKDRANPLSQEFVIEDLRRNEFDVIELQ